MTKDVRDAAAPLPPKAYYDFFKTSGAGQSVVVMPGGVSLTRQEFAQDCDINVLMKRFENQDIGAIMRRGTEPVYVDWSEMPSDLMDYMQRMGDAEKAFMTLPASVRKEFQNDPVAFVEFASDPANLDQMRTWELAPPAPKAVVPPADPPVPPAVPSPPLKAGG